MLTVYKSSHLNTFVSSFVLYDDDYDGNPRCSKVEEATPPLYVSFVEYEFCFS